MTTQPEALQLAELFESYAVDHQPDGWPAIRQETLNSAAAELRRLHAENEAMREERNRNLDSIQVGNNIIQRLKDENEALRVALDQPAQSPVAKVIWPSASGLPSIEWLVKSSEISAEMLLFSAPQPAQQALNIKPPNESGETLCKVRWMAETPNGWVGSYDKAALEQFAAPQPAQQPEADKLLRQALGILVGEYPEGHALAGPVITAIRKHLGGAS